MSEKTYIYKLDKRYKNRPEILLKYGFACYKSEEDADIVFSYPVFLKETDYLFVQCVRFLEHAYDEATSEEREADFKDFEFKKVLTEKQEWKTELVLTDELRKEFSGCQLCMGIFGNEKNVFFINSPLQDSYYNWETVRSCAEKIIDLLLKDHIIYAKKIKIKKQK